MKFQFEIQTYQTDAVNNIAAVFEGQPYKGDSVYNIDSGERHLSQIRSDDSSSSNGFENCDLEISDAQLLKNIQKIQTDNNIKKYSKKLSTPFGDKCRCSLDIEMETGTGKTYVYIKSIFELNKKYGWSKYIVVVPTIAIREGVKKSFEQLEDHFYKTYKKNAYYFTYNSGNLDQIIDFSSRGDISVMIINSQAFASNFIEGSDDKTSKIIYSEQDSFGSSSPIKKIASNHPIIIIDEPQKLLHGEATTNGIKAFNPLFTMNFSATHIDTHNLIYVLDSVEAYKQKLVKKIQVKGVEFLNLQGKDGFIYLSDIRVSSGKDPIAKVSFDVKYTSPKMHIKQETRFLSKGADLFELSGHLNEYKDDYVISQIDYNPKRIILRNGMEILAGQSFGNIQEKDVVRIQIRETILSHFSKEEELFNRGIKCLSLFFIDRVEKYRRYSADGPELGEYGKIFEEEYENVLNDYKENAGDKYKKYLDNIKAEDTHKGYFSVDKKTGKCVNSREEKGECEDESAFDLILKDKERLLSLDEPVRFIFSHSALREGWDNPNVFQICTLKQNSSDITKRQEVGRGMRLCVDINGVRKDFSSLGPDFHDINLLTVITGESYTDYVSKLQKEIKDNITERVDAVSIDYFVGKYVPITGNETHIISQKEATKAFIYYYSNQYIDENDCCVTSKYIDDMSNGKLADFPEELKGLESAFTNLVKATYDANVDITKYLQDAIADGRPIEVENNLIEENFFKKEFQELWKKINHKYAYKVDFDSNELVNDAIEEIDKKLRVGKFGYKTVFGTQGDDDVEFGEKEISREEKDLIESNVRFDLVGEISEGTNLTRKTVCAILKGIKPEKFSLFKLNPEQFISECINHINARKATRIVQAITYNVTQEESYSSEIFTSGKTYLDSRTIETKRHITPYVVTDSNVEKDMTKQLEISDEVCVYAKLPRKFKIPTPVGEYSPDWAISFYEGSVKYIYLVAETKGNVESLQLKSIEDAKISCAEKLFNTLSEFQGTIVYSVVDSYEDILKLFDSLKTN